MNLFGKCVSPVKKFIPYVLPHHSSDPFDVILLTVSRGHQPENTGRPRDGDTSKSSTEGRDKKVGTRRVLVDLTGEESSSSWTRYRALGNTTMEQQQIQ